VGSRANLDAEARRKIFAPYCISPIPNFIQIHEVVLEMKYTDGRTEV
jgi:hypothetical protein